MKRKFLFILIFLGCYFNLIAQQDYHFELDSFYPRWLKNDFYSTEQTSGIAFLRNNKSNKFFLLADDIGQIHSLIISSDTIFNFEPIKLSKSISEQLFFFPKKDFEEIAYDKNNGDVYLSIEGNKPDPKKFCGIYKIVFKNNNALSDSILDFIKLDIKPIDLFIKYVDDNKGYEGLAVDKKYLYLGFEGFGNKDSFADSTIIFVVDKKSLKIVKEISTKNFGIHSICGLFSNKDFVLWGIDRNRKKIFNLTFDNKLNIKESKIFDIQTFIPNYRNIDYTAMLESITMDDEDNFYLVDDPWKAKFVPDDIIFEKLDKKTRKNFKKYIPIIYKYKMKK